MDLHSQYFSQLLQDAEKWKLLQDAWKYSSHNYEGILWAWCSAHSVKSISVFQPQLLKKSRGLKVFQSKFWKYSGGVMQQSPYTVGSIPVSVTADNRWFYERLPIVIMLLPPLLLIWNTAGANLDASWPFHIRTSSDMEHHESLHIRRSDHIDAKKSYTQLMPKMAILIDLRIF